MKKIVQYQTVIKKEKGPYYEEEEVIYVIAMDEDGVLWIKNASYTDWLRF